jgi:uncharacterized membrane protein
MEDKIGVMVFFTALVVIMVSGWALAKNAGAGDALVSWLEGAIIIVLLLFLVAGVANRMWLP